MEADPPRVRFVLVVCANLDGPYRHTTMVRLASYQTTGRIRNDLFGVHSVGSHRAATPGEQRQFTPCCLVALSLVFVARLMLLEGNIFETF